ncbi:MAG: hypothetical protein R3F60_18765 [bacterium]
MPSLHASSMASRPGRVIFVPDASSTNSSTTTQPLAAATWRRSVELGPTSWPWPVVETRA